MLGLVGGTGRSGNVLQDLASEAPRPRCLFVRGCCHLAQSPKTARCAPRTGQPMEEKILFAFDRKVVVEMLPPNYSCYELARAWAHNHPDRGSISSVRPSDDSSFRCVSR